MSDYKSIVLYYTWAGHTKNMAEIIAKQTGADIQEIVPETPYTKNYNDTVNQAKKEIYKGYCPPIKEIIYDLTEYDVVYLGTPIWWGTMAPPVATFLKENNLSGKTIMPFTTHGGGGKGHSDEDIKKMCPNATVLNMYTAYEGGGNNAEKEIADWLKQNKLI